MALIDKIGMNRWWLKALAGNFVGSSYSLATRDWSKFGLLLSKELE
jgi:hypothetical protein